MYYVHGERMDVDSAVRPSPLFLPTSFLSASFSPQTLSFSDSGTEYNLFSFHVQYVRKIKAFDARIAWHEENSKLVRKADRKHTRLSAKQQTLEEQGLVATPEYEDCVRKVRKWAQLREQFQAAKYPGGEENPRTAINQG
jgi:hypothetical protein